MIASKFYIFIFIAFSVFQNVWAFREDDLSSTHRLLVSADIHSDDVHRKDLKAIEVWIPIWMKLPQSNIDHYRFDDPHAASEIKVIEVLPDGSKTTITPGFFTLSTKWSAIEEFLKIGDHFHSQIKYQSAAIRFPGLPAPLVSFTIKRNYLDENKVTIEADQLNVRIPENLSKPRKPFWEEGNSLISFGTKLYLAPNSIRTDPLFSGDSMVEVPSLVSAHSKTPSPASEGLKIADFKITSYQIYDSTRVNALQHGEDALADHLNDFLEEASAKRVSRELHRLILKFVSYNQILAERELLVLKQANDRARLKIAKKNLELKNQGAHSELLPEPPHKAFSIGHGFAEAGALDVNLKVYPEQTPGDGKVFQLEVTANPAVTKKIKAILGDSTPQEISDRAVFTINEQLEILDGEGLPLNPRARPKDYCRMILTDLGQSHAK